MPDRLIVGELKGEWQVVCQCLSKYPWIHLIVGAPIKGDLIQYRERKFSHMTSSFKKDGANLGSENS